MEAADELLRMDLAYVEPWITRMVTVPLSQNQFDALVSFAFNVGVTALRYSTLLRLLNQGLYDEAASQFLRWDKARVDGKLVPVAGLAKRRQRERLLFLDKPEEQP
jgi:lysozyme